VQDSGISIPAQQPLNDFFVSHNDLDYLAYCIHRQPTATVTTATKDFAAIAAEE
jgi:hypothetical protein